MRAPADRWSPVASLGLLTGMVTWQVLVALRAGPRFAVDVRIASPSLSPYSSIVPFLGPSLSHHASCRSRKKQAPVKNGGMPETCAFCGSAGPLTREHVFGQWVSKTGLDLTPIQHFAGPLNALPRDMGEQPPYRQKVKNFCAACNNGWMSNLEAVAQRVLAPFIRGESGAIAVEDQAAIATWVQKTALTAMLLSSKEQRDSGYGLDPAEYKS